MVYKLLVCRDFQAQSGFVFIKNGLEERKYQVNSKSGAQNVLWISNLEENWQARKARVAQITTSYNYAL